MLFKEGSDILENKIESKILTERILPFRLSFSSWRHFSAEKTEKFLGLARFLITPVLESFEKMLQSATKTPKNARIKIDDEKLKS